MTALAFQLLEKSPNTWIDCALSNFELFLIDHAACERKASATGVQFVVRFPDKPRLMDPMLRLAREELLHFHQVMRIILQKGIKLLPDEKDPYVNELLKLCRNGREHHLLDRLLIFGLIEARGTERFGLVAKHIEEPELKKFYQQLTDAEARHHELFLELALEYYSENEVRTRVQELCEAEANIMKNAPLRPAVH